jgi:Tn3 transposase DDE domain
VRVDSLNANHSFKYFGKEQGVSVYTFRDERDLLWHSLVFSAADRANRALRWGEHHPVLEWHPALHRYDQTQGNDRIGYLPPAQFLFKAARVYHALKAFGQILKSIFILRVIDEPVLRMSIEKVLSAIEHVHAFTRAVSIGNPREFLQAEKEDQEMAEACKRLIKNCIICWNYLYLSQKLAEIDDPAKR